jgi:hypothetical protein
MIKEEHAARMNEMRIVYICYCKVRDKRDLARYKRRKEDNIQMEFKQKGREGVNWITLAEVRSQWRTLVKG